MTTHFQGKLCRSYTGPLWKQRTLLVAFFMLIISGCASNNSVVVNSANQDDRIRIVVIHYTSTDFQNSLKTLTQPSGNPVSSHYLVPEPGDPSYPQDQLKLYTLVPEDGRAWHAGGSYWGGRTALNDMSIGIELVNRTYCHKSSTPTETGNTPLAPTSICFYPDFPDTQIEILVELLEGIQQRHPQVKATSVIGHSDIAPQRKVDPGPRFPWQRLYTLGYGAWPDDETVIRYWEIFRFQLPEITVLQQALSDYGYKIDISGEVDEQTQNVIRAFQLHFLPWNTNTQFDPRTVATLYALLEKYHPRKLPQQLQTTNLDGS